MSTPEPFTLRGWLRLAYQQLHFADDRFDPADVAKLTTAERQLLDADRDRSNADRMRLETIGRLLDDGWLRNRWRLLAADVREPWSWQVALLKLVSSAIAVPAPGQRPDLVAAREALQAFKTLVRLTTDRGLGAYVAYKATGDWGEPEWPDEPWMKIVRIALRDAVIDGADDAAIRKLQGQS